MKLEEIRRERIAMQRMGRVPVQQLLEQLKRETYAMAQESGKDSSLYMTVNGQMVVEISGHAGVKGFANPNKIFMNGKEMDRKSFNTFLELAAKSNNLKLDVRTADDEKIKNEYLGQLPSQLGEVQRKRMELQQQSDCNKHLDNLVNLLKQETYLMAKENGADTSLYLVLDGEFIVEVKGHAGQKGLHEKNKLYLNGNEFGSQEMKVVFEMLGENDNLKIEVKTADDIYIRENYLEEQYIYISSSNFKEETNAETPSKQTVIINAFSASDAGQTCALDLTAELKKRGIKAEYVPSFRKELQWEESNLLDGAAESERAILEEQKRRIDRVYGKVEAVVTDAPLLMGAAYCQSQSAKTEFVQIHNLYRNFCFYANGRNEQSEPALKELSEKIHSVLKSNNIFYGNYGQEPNDKLINNIYKYVKGVGHEQSAPAPAETQTPPEEQGMQQF